MSFQTRNEAGEIREFKLLENAFNYAAWDKTIWKISFSAGEKRERVRLIRTEHGWLYENIYGNRNV